MPSKTAADVSRPPKKEKLTEEELGKSLERLYDQPVKKKKAKDDADKADIDFNMQQNTCKPRAAQSKRDVEICERLYTNPMLGKKRMIEQLESKHLFSGDEGSKKKLTEQDAEDAVQRLYATSMEHKTKVKDAVEKKVYGTAPPPRKLNQDSLKDNVDKLYSKAVEQKKDNLAALTDKYIFKQQESKKISKAEVNELVNRLGSKG